MLIHLGTTDSHGLFGKDDGSVVQYPRVTHVLGRFFPLQQSEDVLEQAAERGRFVHKASVYLDGGGDGTGLAWGSVNPVYRPYLRAYESFLKVHEAEVVYSQDGERLSEFSILNDMHGYCGTVDRVMSLVIKKQRIKSALIDLKTGVKLKHHRLQTAAYEDPIRRVLGKHLPLPRFGLYLKANGTFELIPQESGRDWFAWLGYLQAFNWENAA